jgi:hypothetical protein
MTVSILLYGFSESTTVPTVDNVVSRSSIRPPISQYLIVAIDPTSRLRATVNRKTGRLLERDSHFAF